MIVKQIEDRKGPKGGTGDKKTQIKIPVGHQYLTPLKWVISGIYQKRTTARETENWFRGESAGSLMVREEEEEGSRGGGDLPDRVIN